MNLPEFSSPELIGIPIKQVSSFHSLAISFKGKKLLCHVVNGHPATFNVVDLETNNIVFKKTIIGAESSWRLLKHQHTVYIAGTGDSGRSGHLFSYNLETKDFEEYGVVYEGEKFLWSLATDDSRYVYIGTWPNGKIIQFDTNLKKFVDFGTIVSGQNYLRALTYLDGYLYAGIGPMGSLVKIDPSSFDPQSGSLEIDHLEDPVKNLLNLQSLPFCYELASSFPYVLAFFSTDTRDLFCYNTQTDTWKHLTAGYKGTMITSDLGDVYYTTKDGLFRFNGAEGTPKLVSSKVTAALHGGGILEDELYSMFFNGSIFSFNLNNQTAKITKSPAEGANTLIQSIFKGPDNNLYFSAYPSGTGAMYNPKTDRFTRFPLEQAEGMGSIGSDIYFGVYPHARIYKIDTTLPLDQKTHPEMIWQIEDKQDRPFVVTSGNDLLIIGTIPTYGVLGGGISIYDPKGNSGETYAPVIPDHSVTSLLCLNGFLYGGTSIHGGLGISPTQEHALMFKWNLQTKKLEKTFMPLNEAKEAPMISGLCEINGLIYGNFNGFIFVYDPVKERTVKYRNLYPAVKQFGRWRPTYNILGTDGLLYSSVGGYITAIDPETLNFKTIARSDRFALGKDNEVYYVKGWQLLLNKAIRGTRHVLSTEN